MWTRRQFSREFKVEAVKLVTERGVVVAQAARDLDVNKTRLRAWMRQWSRQMRSTLFGVSRARLVCPKSVMQNSIQSTCYTEPRPPSIFP